MTSQSWKFCPRKWPKTCPAANGGASRSPGDTTGSWSMVKSPLKTGSLRGPCPASFCGMVEADQTAAALTVGPVHGEPAPSDAPVAQAGGGKPQPAGRDDRHNLDTQR